MSFITTFCTISFPVTTVVILPSPGTSDFPASGVWTEPPYCHACALLPPDHTRSQLQWTLCFTKILVAQNTHTQTRSRQSGMPVWAGVYSCMHTLTSRQTIPKHNASGPIYWICWSIIMNTFIHQNGRLTDRDNTSNRLRTYCMQSLLVLWEWKEYSNTRHLKSTITNAIQNELTLNG